jgi:hypothetical protein
VLLDGMGCTPRLRLRQLANNIKRQLSDVILNIARYVPVPILAPR